MTAILSLLGPWIGPDALVVVERSTRAPAPTWPSFLVLEDQRTWGKPSPISRVRLCPRTILRTERMLPERPRPRRHMRRMRDDRTVPRLF